MRSRSLMMTILAGVCLAPVLAHAGWPFSSEGPTRGTPEFYEWRATDPVGARQEYKYGKLWPPRPRPVGRKQLPIHKYHAAHYWPYPYTCQDRASVTIMANTQVANGWLAATTFHEFHFDPVTHELNSSGQRHLQWLLTDVPPQFRQAYVAAPLDQSAGDRRVASIQAQADRLAGADAMLPVVLRTATPHGRPAHETQMIHDGRIQNMLPPTIQYTSGPGGGGGGGGGS
ncbi:MAG: hypothetical protein ACF8TS_17480 [Maioricimonas sp. JB049]